MSVDCYTCPQPANYAAVALQLQKTAMDAEGCIYTLEKQLRGATNRPTIVNITSSAPSIAPSTRTQIALATTLTFTNSTTLTLIATPPSGIYETGMWLNATPSGATTDNSFRQLEVVTRGALTPSTEADASSAASIVFESSSGLGMDMLINTVVTVDGTQAIRFFFTHNNASNVTIAAGAIVWATKISELAVPRVVI